jgi:predicted O-methyltransferase YrrM
MLPKELDRYISAMSRSPDDVLLQVERATHLYTIAPQMISGHVQGALLTMLAQLIGAQRILEIGAFTGYGTICLARGLAEGPDSRVTSIEANPEFEYLIRRHIDLAGLEDTIDLRIGDARGIIPTLPETWDLVFIDANKLEYADYFGLVIDRVRPGGLILADNVLWGGKVLHAHKDLDAAAIHAYNELVRDDPRVDVVLLPLRDGLSVARKK